MNLFIAATFSDAAVERIIDTRDRLRAVCESGDFSPRALIHLTLVFIGDLPLSRAAPVERAIDEAALGYRAFCGGEGHPLEITVAGLGSFPRKNGGGVFFAGVRKTPGLIALQSGLCGALKKEGVAFDERPYTPHVTLGYRVVTGDGFDPVAFNSREPFSDCVSSIKLFQSRFYADGEKYALIYEKRLSGK